MEAAILRSHNQQNTTLFISVTSVIGHISLNKLIVTDSKYMNSTIAIVTKYLLLHYATSTPVGVSPRPLSYQTEQQ